MRISFGRCVDAAMSRLTILAYDIADDARRRRVARVCEQRMLRVQDSVFDAWMTSAERARLLRAVHDVIEPTLDQVRLYALASRGHGRCRSW